MRAAQQSGDPGGILEYTTYWTELVDRGGLYINNDVYRLVEAVELIVRSEINTESHKVGTNLSKVI
jgi:hypothetical protein